MLSLREKKTKKKKMLGKRTASMLETVVSEESKTPEHTDSQQIQETTGLDNDSIGIIKDYAKSTYDINWPSNARVVRVSRHFHNTVLLPVPPDLKKKNCAN